MLRRDDAAPGAKREYSTYAVPPQDGSAASGAVDIGAIGAMPAAADAAGEAVEEADTAGGLPEGAKFPLPELPLPPTSNLSRRYSPIVAQVTGLLMRHGKACLGRVCGRVGEG